MKRPRFMLVIPAAGLLMAVLACGPAPTSPPTPPPPPPDNPQPTEPPPTDPPQPSGQADLSILNLQINLSSQSGYQHEVVSTIANNGPVDASGFNAGCTYTCPGGLVNSGGLDIVIGGYLGANSTRDYTQAVRISCDPIPAYLYLSCSVNDDGSVPESNMNNNYSNYNAAIPFP